MGKKRIVKQHGSGADSGLKSRALSRLPKKKVEIGRLFVQSTYNNTIISLADRSGNVLCASSSGALGFNGAKKSTPFAAAKVAELMAEKAIQLGMREVDVVVSGVGSGRESSIRAFTGKGIGVTTIQDKTPVPHNGPRSKKPRRV
jgi:small subunit ribosomal protein S11